MLVLAAIALGGRAEAHGRKDLRTRRAVVSPDARIVRPPYRVPIVCGACGGGARDLPDWVVRLGSRLHQAGFEPIPTQSWVSPSDQSGLAAVVAEAGLGPGDAVSVSPPLDDRAVAEVVAQVTARVAPEPKTTRPVRHLFVVRPDTSTGRALHAQATWVAHYAKLDADFIEAQDLLRAPARWVAQYASVVLATETLPGLDPTRLFRLLDSYVRAGGGLAALAFLDEPVLWPIFGLSRAERPEETVETVACDPAWLPGAAGVAFRYGPEWAMTIPRVQTSRDARALCRARTPSGREVPSLVVRSHGEGRALMWLSGEVGDKSARGRILLSVLEVSAPAAGAMMDALVFWVDDCPMPLWGRPIPPVDGLYGMTDAEFYTTRWWPGLSEVLKRYDVKPSFGFVLSYDARVAPPFASGFQVEKEDREGDRGEAQSATSAVEAATALARSIYDAGHEIALHGYNHQSLTVAKCEQSAGWSGLEPMVQALSLAREEMVRLFGTQGLPVTYVAPNNLVHALGKQAVHRVFPEITAIAAQYLDEDSILGQEFGPDPDVEGLVDIPRISSEHFLDEGNAAEVLDALVVPGVLSHFIHPDDIYDPARSRGQDLDGLLRELDRLLGHVRGAYPFLRAMRARELATLVRGWSQVRLEVTRGPKSLVLRGPGSGAGGLTAMVRLPAGADAVAHGSCEVVFRSAREGRYYVRVGESPCTLRWE